jgi:hypothetical protein
MIRVPLATMFWSKVFLLTWSLCPLRLVAADAEVCSVCGRPIIEIYYSFEDKVTLEKKHVCKDCEKSYPECFVCGLPANTNAVGFLELSDQRVLCARDARTAVLREEDGLRICREARDSLDRLFSRFTTFPETNVRVGLVDRVHLLDLFKLAGNDYHCPNAWGITQTKTNHSRSEYHIGLMTGLPLSWFQATCAHEYTHAWIGEHLSQSRKDSLSRDAEEGFCELVSLLFMESLGNEAQKALILRNAYTRGQIELFVAAQRRYGFNEILDWMQFGTDDQLSATDPGRVRKVEMPRHAASPGKSLAVNRTESGRAPDALVLKAIFWDEKRPLALINDRMLGVNEEAKVHVGTTNVLVRRLSIFPDAVQLRVVGTDQDQTLRLK